MSTIQEGPVTERQVNALKECIDKKILAYGTKGTKNKKGAIIAQFILIICSVLTPIFIGWNEGTSKLLVNLALISSAITTACSSLQVFFDWKELWTNYKVARNELETIIAEIDYQVAIGYDKIDQETMQKFFERYKAVCFKMDESYRSIRASVDDNAATQ